MPMLEFLPLGDLRVGSVFSAAGDARRRWRRVSKTQGALAGCGTSAVATAQPASIRLFAGVSFQGVMVDDSVIPLNLVDRGERYPQGFS